MISLHSAIPATGYSPNLEGIAIYLETFGTGWILKTINATGSDSGIVFKLTGIDTETCPLIIRKDTGHSGH